MLTLAMPNVLGKVGQAAIRYARRKDNRRSLEAGLVACRCTSLCRRGRRTVPLTAHSNLTSDHEQWPGSAGVWDIFEYIAAVRLLAKDNAGQRGAISIYTATISLEERFVKLLPVDSREEVREDSDQVGHPSRVRD